MGIVPYNPKAQRRHPEGIRHDFYYRLPGRDPRTEQTHKMPKDMNRKEWRAFLRDIENQRREG
jgi:hypothetical protein